jgi:hypothetical protein
LSVSPASAMKVVNYFADVGLLLVTCVVVTLFFNKYASWRQRSWLVMISVWIGERLRRTLITNLTLCDCQAG